jgi:hypothetical protein
LADPSPGTRAAAAKSFFDAGLQSCRSILDRWLGNSELDSLFRRHAGEPSGGHQNLAATVGIAVSPESFEKIRAANGSPHLADVPPDQDAKEFELHFGERVRLDILTTKAPAGSGAIARFLSKLGEGIQQVEFEVSDVDAATEILETNFHIQPLYPATRPGADGTRVNFFLANTPEGKKVLIEFVESR